MLTPTLALPRSGGGDYKGRNLNAGYYYDRLLLPVYGEEAGRRGLLALGGMVRPLPKK
jgi:hypothetical protein